MEKSTLFRISSSSHFYDHDMIENIRLYSDFFQDEEFPCDIVSLINFDDDNLSNEQKLTWLGYEWKRIPDIYGQDKIKLLSSPSSTDVKQGSLGNCYLLSVGAVIAEYPKRLEQMFIVKEINRAGIYAVRLHIEGEWKVVIVDDRIPVNYGQPPFAKVSGSYNIWPIILEKAWAKQLRNYQNTIAGVPSEIFKIMTGAPSFYINLSKVNHSSLWNKLQECFFNNYYICAASLSDSELEDRDMRKELKSKGLSMNHAYSCMVFFEFESSGKKMRLVKLRNPWGKLDNNSFMGEIIRHSYNTNEAIRQNLGQETEGVLILTYEEFTKYFSRVYICQYHDNYNLFTEKLYQKSKSEHFKAYKVNLTYCAKKVTGKKLFFTINKPTKYCFTRGNSLSSSLYYSIFVGEIIGDTNRINYIGYKEGFESMLTVELDSYNSSEYIVFVHCDEYKGKSAENGYLGYLSLYSSEEFIFMEPIDNCNTVLKSFQHLIHDYYTQFRSTFVDKYSSITDDGLIHMNSFTFENGNYGFVVYENQKPSAILNLGLSITTSFDLERDGKGLVNRIPYEHETSLMSGEYLILIYYSCSMKYKYVTNVVLDREELKREANLKGKTNSVGQFKYLTFSHNNGMVIKFINHTSKMIKIKLTYTQNQNLICYDFPTNSYEVYVSPKDDFYLFLEKVNMREGFSLNYNIAISNA
jgi:hypothetical protein